MTDETVTTSELAAWLGCTDRAVRDYATRGLIAPASRGRYPLRASVARVIEHLRAVASQHRSAALEGEPDALDLTAQRALLAKRQRERLEREAAEAARELVRASEVRAAWFKLARGARDALLTMPDRIAPILASETDPTEVHALLLAELERTLHNIAREPVTGSRPDDVSGPGTSEARS